MIRQRFFSLLVTILLCLLASSLNAASFSKTDLAGSWRGVWLETLDSDLARYWLEIDITFDSSGNLTSGTWSSAGGSSGAITAGALRINSRGAVTGKLEYGHGASTDLVISIEHGQMDMDKEIVYLALKKQSGELAAGMLTKYATDSGFSTLDLAGSWEAILFETNPVNAYNTYWLDTNMTLDTYGTGSGIWNYYLDNINGDITAVNLSLPSGQGTLAGSLNLDNGIQVNVEKGQIDFKASCGSIATLKTNSVNELSGGIFLRTGGSGYQQADLAGTWAIFHTRVKKTSPNDMFWLAGEVKISEAGDITGGAWAKSNGETGLYSSGSWWLSSSGGLTGYHIEGIQSFSIQGGHLGRTKNYGAVVTKSPDNNILDMIFFIRKTNAVNLLPATMLLLN